MLNVALASFFLMVFVLPQSYAIVKLPLLFLCVGLIAINALRGTYKIASRSSFLYYLVFSSLAAFWSIIGALRGNPDQAIIESTTLYVVYMWIYAVLVLHLSSTRLDVVLKPFISVVSIGISLFCFYVLVDYFLALDWLGESIKEEMYLGIGVHDGYIQMNNINVGMYCFLIPYLFASILIEGRSVGKLTIFAFGLSIVGVLLASRRIVLVLVFLAPLLTYATLRLTGGPRARVFGRCIRSYVVFLLFGASFLIWLYEYNQVIFEGLTHRMTEIFAVDPHSERQKQHLALVAGFLDYPVFGSGFGGLVEIIRSVERPWTFELTYSKLLFNSGLVGVISLAVFFGTFLLHLFSRIRATHSNQLTFVPLLVGFFSVILAAGSNPYLSSFDFLFVMSVIPLMLNLNASVVVGRGFESQNAAEAAGT